MFFVTDTKFPEWIISYPISFTNIFSLTLAYSNAQGGSLDCRISNMDTITNKDFKVSTNNNNTNYGFCNSNFISIGK